MLKRWLLYVGSVIVGLAAVGALLGAFVVALLYPTLPSLDTLTDYQPRIPLRVVSAEGDLLGEFGEERRAIVNIKDVPAVMKNAILAAEDERFYQHGGVDYVSVMRAALSNMAGGAQQGAGTITMQVARNFFLTREKTLTRKLREVLLAWKIEANLSKDEILQLYLNQIYLGQRAYGFAAAAQIYFGKTLAELTPAEAAMLAGLPKAPSAYNPVANPERAKVRQMYVLRRMHELHFLDDAAWKQAQVAPLVIRQGLREAAGGHAEFVAEMARQVVYEAYGDDAYSRGITVWTTIRKADQEAAWQAVRRGVIDYDHRHGYRGPEAYIALPPAGSERDTVLERTFAERPDDDTLVAAVVTAATPAEVKAILANGDDIAITGDGLKFVARALTDKSPSGQRIRPGAVIRVVADDKGHYTITQLPQAESALVAMRPTDGALIALVGGFAFDRNKFNHATQAMRQPGSSFKPFIYSAALEKGFTPATIVNDAPFFVPAEQAGGEAWEPKNYEGKFEGPMRLRMALAKSKNLVAVRVLQAIGVQYAQDYITRFGFDPKQHPAYLTMALGAGSATPMQMASAYSVFANGGYRIAPYLIAKITDAKGEVLSAAKPQVAGDGADRAIDPRNAFIMTTMMRDVIVYGTGAAAMSLKRHDLAGKTGTTNENVDAWFCGFNAEQVAVAWIGFDQPRTLGNGETGGVAALPIWISYMQRALKGTPETPLTPPDGVVAVHVNADSGLRDDSSTLTDYFFSENTPRARDDGVVPQSPTRSAQEVRNQIF
ncbi:MAG: penicillin-binding protein 1A [Proteobacteria bacterium]|nr:penicillin-binding protein 1A [Pseudomonadota bacterium]